MARKIKKVIKIEKRNFTLDQRVFNDTYGGGNVIFSGKGRNGSENYGIKFDNGGPQGWASRATHDIADLVAVV